MPLAQWDLLALENGDGEERAVVLRPQEEEPRASDIRGRARGRLDAGSGSIRPAVARSTPPRLQPPRRATAAARSTPSPPRPPGTSARSTPPPRRPPLQATAAARSNQPPRRRPVPAARVARQTYSSRSSLVGGERI